jgi:threonine dehydratase
VEGEKGEGGNAKAKAGAGEVTLQNIEAAGARISGAVEKTECDQSRTLSELFGAEIWLKRENLQFTGSFKERGALNRLLALDEAERKKGVIAMSAGNHAQGVAYHAQRLGIPAFIVMPEQTPTVKVENTRGHGAQVILKGTQLEESAEFAHAYGREKGLTFVHPYDDRLVIAGQGTVATEMLGAAGDLEVLIVPIGGGGLISGIAIAAKAIKPDIEVVGVEARLYPSMYNAINGADLPMRGDTLAEGIAVKSPGRITTPLVRRFVDDIVLVSEPQLERAVSLLIGIEKTVVEGAGAAGLAAILADPERFRGRKVGLVLCGGNIDTRLLAGVLTRELARQGCLTQLSIDIPDRPGQLATVSSVLAKAEANVVEVYHQRVFTELPAKGAELHVVIETRDRAHLESVIDALKTGGYDVAAKGAPE